MKRTISYMGWTCVPGRVQMTMEVGGLLCSLVWTYSDAKDWVLHCDETTEWMGYELIERLVIDGPNVWQMATLMAERRLKV